MVTIPTITFLIIAVLTRPSPNLALKNPVKATDKVTAKVVPGHLMAFGNNVIATNGKIPPDAAETSEEKAASQGFM